MFKQKYDGSEHVRYAAEPGSRYKKERAPVLDKQGNKKIKEKGEIDFQAYINSWRDDCDINILIAKYTAGDKHSLLQRAGMYMDVSNLPDNFNDLMNVTMQAESVFDSLPVAAKQAFGNNVNNFLSNAGSKEWVELLSKSPDDFRKEIIRNSNNYTKENRENFIESKYSLGSASGSDVVIKEEAPSLTEEVTRVVGGKLNEQKQ